MTVAVDDLREDLVVDFAMTRTQLIEARRRHRTKGTPDSRSTVEECQAQIDRVLDMYLEMVHRPPR